MHPRPGSGRSGLRAWLQNEAEQYTAERGRILLAILSVLLLSMLMFPLRERLGVLNIALLFLLLSFLLGLGLATRPAIVGALLSFLTFDFVFIPPYYTMTVAALDHVLALVIYLGAAVTSSLLVARVREQTRQIQREARRIVVLYDLNRALILGSNLDSLLQAITRSVVEIYGAQGSRMLTLSDDDMFITRARWPRSLPETLGRDERSIAKWAVDSRTMAGLGSEGRTIRPPHGLPEPPRRFHSARSVDVLYIPITTPGGVRGVLEVNGRPGGGLFRQEDKVLLGTFADQAALALERARLVEEATRTAVLEQTSELKSSLIAAVSHDLRTPLTGIKASASALLDTSVAWTEEDRHALLDTIDEETDRLTFMVSNLLDLSRIEGGALRPDKEWHDISELIDESVRRSGRFFADRPVTVDIDPGLPLAPLDWVYTSQVLMNLLSNAGKYTPPGTPIKVSARRHNSSIEIRVHDEGPGIMPDKLPHIFDTFYRAQAGRTVSGSGIGLAICKGLVEAQGGTIRVVSQPGRGATFIVQLPLDEDVV